MDKTDLIKQMQDITASDELKKRVRKAIVKDKLRTFSKASGGVIAAMLTLCIVSFNLSPSLAAAAGDVPVLGSIMRIVTLARYEKSDNGYLLEVNAPKIEGMFDSELENRLNTEFSQTAADVIEQYESDVAKLKESFGDEVVHMGIGSDYEIKADNDEILSLDTYIYNTSGSSNVVHSYYNIEKETSRLLALPDLFIDGADYVSVINEYIAAEINRLNQDENSLFWSTDDVFDGFKTISSEQKFYINESGKLVICFDKYQIAAGAAGSPEFEIPFSVIESIAASPLLK